MKKTFILLSLFSVCSAFYSCSKDTRPYQLNVEVKANDSIFVQNALVRVYAPVDNTFIDYYGYTDKDGICTFEFDNKAILEISAGKGSLKGCNYVELEKGVKTVNIDMMYYNDPKNGCKVTGP